MQTTPQRGERRLFAILIYIRDTLPQKLLEFYAVFFSNLFEFNSKTIDRIVILITCVDTHNVDDGFDELTCSRYLHLKGKVMEVNQMRYRVSVREFKSCAAERYVFQHTLIGFVIITELNKN